MESIQRRTPPTSLSECTSIPTLGSTSSFLTTGLVRPLRRLPADFSSPRAQQAHADCQHVGRRTVTLARQMLGETLELSQDPLQQKSAGNPEGAIDEAEPFPKEAWRPCCCTISFRSKFLRLRLELAETLGLPRVDPFAAATG
jgi:hypothetical protein